MIRYDNIPYIRIEEGDCFGDIDIVLENEQRKLEANQDSKDSDHIDFSEYYQFNNLYRKFSVRNRS